MLFNLIRAGHYDDIYDDEYVPSTYGFIAQLFDTIQFALMEYLPEWLAGILTYCIVTFTSLLIGGLLIVAGIEIWEKIKRWRDSTS